MRATPGRKLAAPGWQRAAGSPADSVLRRTAPTLVLLRRRPLNDQRLGEASTLDSLGCIAHHLREYDKALDYYRQALAICRAQGHSHLEPDILRHIGDTEFAQGRVDRARDAWRLARELYVAQHRLAAAERVEQQLDSEQPADRVQPSGEADPVSLEPRA